MKRNYFLFLLFVLLSAGSLQAQSVAVRTNVLHLATTTPNLGLDFAMGKKVTFSASVGYNPFEFSGRYTVEGLKINTKIKHWMVAPELKYWFCGTYQGSYLGISGLYSDFNVGGISCIKSLENDRYRGHLYGGGITYGYHWILGPQCGLELSLGLGYLKINSDRYECVRCGEHLGEYSINYFGPTKAEISFVYLIR